MGCELIKSPKIIVQYFWITHTRPKKLFRSFMNHALSFIIIYVLKKIPNRKSKSTIIIKSDYNHNEKIKYIA